MVYSENYIEQRINHFSQMIKLATSPKAQQFAVKKMLEWKSKRSLSTVQRLELERMKKAKGSV
jgi:predicted RNA-binding protein with PIN domain